MICLSEMHISANVTRRVGTILREDAALFLRY